MASTKREASCNKFSLLFAARSPWQQQPANPTLPFTPSRALCWRVKLQQQQQGHDESLDIYIHMMQVHPHASVLIDSNQPSQTFQDAKLTTIDTVSGNYNDWRI